MITNKEFVSRIANSIKALTKDGRISRRYILNIGRTQAKFLIAQKLGELSLSREVALFKHVPCVELIPISTKDCSIVEFNLCKHLMRSKHKVEGLVSSKFNSGILTVTSIDDGILYKEITRNQYRRNKLRSSSKKHYFYIQDGYIYLPDSENELVDLEVIQVEQEKLDKLSSCLEGDCTSVWHRDFIVPDRLLDIVIKNALQEVASIYSRSIKDENPNLDSNIKSQTIK